MLALAGLTSTACGGRLDPGYDGGTSSSSSSTGSGSTSSGGSSGNGSSSGVTVPPCPSEPPAPGTTCVIGEQGCAYFSNHGCQAFVCDESSVWQSTPEGC
ncbi:MAG TPA: hypothetical protein VIJ22_13380 [Polyangiaceae bacterium]